jgi:hypothetical protein
MPRPEQGVRVSTVGEIIFERLLNESDSLSRHSDEYIDGLIVKLAAETSAESEGLVKRAVEKYNALAQEAAQAAASYLEWEKALVK